MDVKKTQDMLKLKLTTEQILGIQGFPDLTCPKNDLILESLKSTVEVMTQGLLDPFNEDTIDIIGGLYNERKPLEDKFRSMASELESWTQDLLDYADKQLLPNATDTQKTVFFGELASAINGSMLNEYFPKELTDQIGNQITPIQLKAIVADFIDPGQGVDSALTDARKAMVGYSKNILSGAPSVFEMEEEVSVIEDCIANLDEDLRSELDACRQTTMHLKTIINRFANELGLGVERNHAEVLEKRMSGLTDCENYIYTPTKEMLARRLIVQQVDFELDEETRCILNSPDHPQFDKALLYCAKVLNPDIKGIASYMSLDDARCNGSVDIINNKTLHRKLEMANTGLEIS